MIFVTVGTHQQPFDRLLEALETLDGEELIVQHGPGKAPANAAHAEAFMPFDRIIDLLGRADRVITHAGVGSIICARRAGHLPLVVPRRHDLGEHVDDHQAELTRSLEARGAVIPVWDVGELSTALASAPPRGPSSEPSDPQLCGAVRAALLGAPRA